MGRRGIKAAPLEVYHHEPDISGFDLIVAPVHLPPDNPTFKKAVDGGKAWITHHQAVGELLCGEKEFRVFEITGTHSKTTTALILAKILSAKRRIVSHTTRGVELWEGGNSQVLRAGLSITPGNVIVAMELARSCRADDLICEISLGGTGLADYGILTSFAGDYKIADETRWASKAKLQMVDLASFESKLIANVDTNTAPDLSFGIDGDVQCDAKEIRAGKTRCDLELGEGFDPKSYVTGLSAAVAAAMEAGFPIEDIVSSLKGFEGFSGRMKRTYEAGVIVYDNSNSGLKLSGVEEGLDYAKGEGLLGLVVGEEAETVCEGMDIPGLVELLKTRREEIDVLVLVGERLESYAQELGALTAPDLPAGNIRAKESLKKGDRLLSCVKCFR